MNETGEGGGVCRGHGEMKVGGGRSARGTKTTSCSIWVKSRGMIYSRLGVIPPSPCSTCLSERSEKLETAQEERTIFKPSDRRYCGLTLKLKIQISMYSEMNTVLRHYKPLRTSLLA